MVRTRNEVVMYEQGDLQLVSFVLSNSLRGGGINQERELFMESPVTPMVFGTTIKIK